MSKVPIGLIIKDLIARKNLSVANVATALGMSRQSVYQSFNRKHMDEHELSRWAIALSVDKRELEGLMDVENFTEKNTSNDKYLQEYLEKLEVMFNQEISKKNEQINELLRTNQQLAQTNNALVMAQLGRTNFNLRIVDTISSEEENAVGKIILFTPLFEALVVTA
jgi:transcriptional regulator with XRE-family HTH domain